jgi:hypothetical protein
MSVGPDDWAILRQAVLATTDHDGTSRRIRDSLGLAPGFADPLLEEMGLRDETFRIGKEAHLEIVSPLHGDASINKWLAKVGGGGGYCLSIQVPDVQRLVDNAAAAGVRVLADVRHFGRRIVQLHPGDMGLLVELDEIPEANQWFWDDVEAEVPAAPNVDDVLGVEVGSRDPRAQALRWARVFEGERAAAEPSELMLGNRFVRFVEADRPAMTAVHLAATADLPDGAGTAVEVAGVALRLQRA